MDFNRSYKAVPESKVLFIHLKSFQFKIFSVFVYTSFDYSVNIIFEESEGQTDKCFNQTWKQLHKNPRRSVELLQHTWARSVLESIKCHKQSNSDESFRGRKMNLTLGAEGETLVYAYDLAICVYILRAGVSTWHLQPSTSSSPAESSSCKMWQSF
jgi:hypothetical protein